MNEKVKLYDTVVRKRDRKWFRVVEISEGGLELA